MKKFNQFDNNKLSQSKLRQMYGGGSPTEKDSEKDYKDDAGRTTYADGASTSNDAIVIFDMNNRFVNNENT